MKYTNEITVKVLSSYEQLVSSLEELGYQKIDDYVVDDVYLVKNDANLNDDTLDILKQCVLSRNINDQKYTLTYKYKEYDDRGNIINQNKIEVKVETPEKAISFMTSIGYHELIKVYDHIVVYELDGFNVCIEQVNNKYLFIEIEENDQYHGIENLINRLDKLGLNYDHSNYFVSKAKIIFEEKYDRLS